MPDFIDMPSATPAPDYHAIVKGVGYLRHEADSCKRLGSILLTVGSLTAGAAWTFSTATIVRWSNGSGDNIHPELVVGATVCGLGIFLFGWAMCGNFQRKSITLRVTADLAMAQRDVAINSFRPPTVIVQQVAAPEQVETVAPKQVRPPTPPAPKSIPAPLPPVSLAA